METAGFWKLAAAYFVDFVLLTIGGYIIGILAGLFVGAVLGLLGVSMMNIMYVCAVVGGLLGFIFNIVYFAALESLQGASLGKKMLHIKVYKTQ